MPPGLRRFVLTTHAASSVGWFGAVAAFFALAVTGLSSRSEQLVRAAYLAMGLTTWWVIVPLAFVALLSGMVASLGTRWGLFRYYWVLVKLLITLFAIVILLVHTKPTDFLADVAGKTTVLGADLQDPQRLLAFASGATLLVLLVLIALSVYKPRGLTPYGWRRRQEQRARLSS